MATHVKMIMTWVVMFLALFSHLSSVSANLSDQINQEISGKLLEHLNKENESIYSYQNADIIETQMLDATTYFLADVSTSCLDAEDSTCDPKALVCQGAKEQDQLSVYKCFIKEDFPALPNYGQGFIVKKASKFTEEILEHGLEKLERDGGPKRKIIEIISVKKRETSGTELFVTAKVAAGSEDNGDLLELEICELAAVLGTPGLMQILDSETKCFPLVEDSEDSHYGGTIVTSEELVSLSHKALDKVNVVTDVVFNYTLIEIIKADASTTPGSGGLMTTMQLRVASSACPKKSAVPEGVVIEWQCAPTGQPLICLVSAWERPWRGDILFSRLRCKRFNTRSMSTTPLVTAAEPEEQRPGFCTGCVSEVNKNDPKVTELANSAVQMLNEVQLASTPHKLMQVISAHRQVVNGIRYILHVELAMCASEGEPCETTGESSLQCRLELLEGATDRKHHLISSLCQPLNQKQAQTQPTESEVLPTPQAEIEQQTTSQLVAEEPAASVPTTPEEQPAETQGEVDTSTTSEGQKEAAEQIDYTGPHTTQRRSRRSPKLLGGPEDVDLEKEGAHIRQLADMALLNIDDIDDDHSKRKLIEIVGAKRQLVNGVLFHLTLRVGVMPPCDAGEEGCGGDGELPTLLCKVQVHEALPDTKGGQPTVRVMRSECEPEGDTEIAEAPERPADDNSKTTNEASPSRQRRGIPGGINPADINDPYVQEIAQFSLSRLDQGSNALYTRQVVDIISARRQVVAGTLIHLVLKLGYSTCRKGAASNDVCTLQDNVDQEICNVTVWDRPWLKERELQNFTCVPAQHSDHASVRNKRGIPLYGRGTHDIHVGMFNEFIEQHGKEYKDQVEYRKRFHIFRANMRKIQVLKDTEQGTATYGPTKFADLTVQEFKQQYLGLNRDLQERSKRKMKKAVIPNITLPTDFDWRHYNVVTPVKNQGSCGSCWAFSVTGNVEGQWALRRGQLLSLSEQELVDCDKLDEGCNGGLPSNAYESIQKLGGLEAEGDYPYEGVNDKCHFNKSEVRATVTGALNITTDETSMAQWLTKNGPISIGINANAMQFYYGGVSHPWKMLCNPADLDHGVLIVGFGVHTYPIFNKTLPFWTIKNSWGPTWGEQGYYRVYRGDGTCGVNQMATSAIVG